MDDAFKAWVGQPVVLQVALGDIKVPLRGRLLKDDDDTVRMRIGDGWDVDIYKAMILAVEEDSMVLLPAGGSDHQNTRTQIRNPAPRGCSARSVGNGIEPH